MTTDDKTKNTMFQWHNHFMNFYSDRTKKSMNQDKLQMHCWK